MIRKVQISDPTTKNHTRNASLRPFWMISILFLVSGIIISVYAVRLDCILVQSSSWPVAKGTVVSVKRLPNSRESEYTYRYLDNGTLVDSTNIYPGLDAQDFMPYMEGMNVQVVHSPGAKRYSFIRYPDNALIILPNVIGFVFTALGGFALYSLVRSANSQALKIAESADKLVR